MSMLFGATAVGVRARDGVALGSDRRMAYGSFIMSRNARKIFVLDKRIGIAFSGLYGDMRGLYRIIESDYLLMKLTLGGLPSVYSVAKRLSMILYSYKPMPFMVEVIVGGIDPDGKPRLFVLDSLGSITEEPFVAVGSGATIALGLLEEEYSEDMSVEEAIGVVEKAIRTAIKRDASTGDGVDIVAITPSGVIEKTYRLKIVEEK